MDSRGIRNCNPMNIRVSKSRWIGKVYSPNKKDSDFEEFIGFKFGVRAALYLLHRYVYDYDLFTPRLIIARWAPPSENNVNAYCNSFNKYSHISVDSSIKGVYYGLYEVVRVMCMIESGYLLTYCVFNDAFDLLPTNIKLKWL